MRGSKDRILSLPALLALVDGRVPLILEVKSTWTRDGKFEANIAQHARSPIAGPVAVMSFDPHCVAAFRTLAPDAAARTDLRALRRRELLVRAYAAGSASPCAIS